MKIVEIKNLCVFYKNGNTLKSVFKDVNIDINLGEYISIIGKNGTGKSTLVKSILGLVKVNAGKVIFNSVTKSDIGYVPQFSTTFSSIPSTVKEVVLSGMLKSKKLKFFYTKNDKNILLRWLKVLKVEDIVNHKLCELSGGQLKKVLLARALVSHPKFLVLDEPCASLDEDSSAEFYKILYNLNKESKITILIVTHDVKHATKTSSKIIKLENGKATQTTDDSRLLFTIKQGKLENTVC